MKKIQKEIYVNGLLESLSCIKCFEIKDISNFDKCNKRKCKFTAYCKTCSKQQRINYYKKNKEKILEQTREYYENNKLRHKEWEKEWRLSNKEKINKRRKERIKSNPSLKLRNTISRRILKMLKKNEVAKNVSTLELLGTDLQTAKRWIEQQFTENMSWENHGTLWHLDHIIPCCSFDLTDLEEQKKCFNYKNLQPLLASVNCSKANEDKKKSILS